MLANPDVPTSTEPLLRCKLHFGEQYTYVKRLLMQLWGIATSLCTVYIASLHAGEGCHSSAKRTVYPQWPLAWQWWPTATGTFGMSYSHDPALIRIDIAQRCTAKSSWLPLHYAVYHCHDNHSICCTYIVVIIHSTYLNVCIANWHVLMPVHWGV